VPLTSSQIINASASPVTIVAAPGAGKVIVVVNSVYEYTFVTTPYTGDSAALLYGGDPTADADVGDDGVCKLSASSLAYSGSGTAQIQVATTAAADAAITYGIPTGKTPYADGDGTLKVTVYYATLTL